MRIFPIAVATFLVVCSATLVDAKRHRADAYHEKQWYGSYGNPNPVWTATNVFNWTASPRVEPHYVLRTAGGQFPTASGAELTALKAKTLTVEYRIDTVSGTPVIKSTECESWQNPQARVALLLRRSTDNTKRFHRAWLDHRPLIQADGVTYSITAPLSGVGWAFVNGGADNPQNYPGEWNNLLDNLRDIGLTFNGCSSAGHGAYVTGGNAKFTIVSVTVQ
jgi:hypothetical protein